MKLLCMVKVCYVDQLLFKISKQLKSNTLAYIMPFTCKRKQASSNGISTCFDEVFSTKKKEAK